MAAAVRTVLVSSLLLLLASTTAAATTAIPPPKPEVYGFSPSTDPSRDPLTRYDWSVLTTLAWRDDPEAVAQAHASGTRVEYDGRRGAAELIFNASTTAADALRWVARVVGEVVAKDLDGVNFDLENPIKRGAAEGKAYTALVAATRAAAKAATLGRARVTVDVPYLPHDNDGRDYDFLALAAASDALFVMAYDTQALMWGRCVAAANSPLPLVERSVQAWLDLGVPADKLILGLPWYGYSYGCVDDEEEEEGGGGGNGGGRSGTSGDDARDLCRIAAVPYAGAPCSDAGGNQIGYAQIMEREFVWVFCGEEKGRGVAAALGSPPPPSALNPRLPCNAAAPPKNQQQQQQCSRAAATSPLSGSTPSRPRSTSITATPTSSRSSCASCGLTTRPL
jgi:Di-N-acetylchitobiase